MTLNNLIKAVAARLTELWPDRKVLVDRIPRDADGNFFVGIIESEQEKHLDRRRKRSVQLEVLYFLRSDDSMDFNDWAESMYDSFEVLTVKETEDRTREVHLTGQTARRDDGERVYQFMFDADFFFVLTPDDIPGMDDLELTEVLK